jgi:serine/threonine protein kinase
VISLPTPALAAYNQPHESPTAQNSILPGVTYVMIGKTLAHYEITGQLVKDGMGEVYQAKDRKLGREVAIKVLSEEFARDTDRIARFQR